MSNTDSPDRLQGRPLFMMCLAAAGVLYGDIGTSPIYAIRESLHVAHGVEPGVSFEPMRTSYFLGRERVIATSRPGMAIWRENLFAMMSRNAEGVTRYFGIPPNRVVELGMQVEI